MQLHLLDGTYELFRAHFGQPSRRSSSGQQVQGVYGLITSTLGLLQEPAVTHVGAAFDTVVESFRNELYPGYKTGAGVPAELFAQFPLAEQAMKALGVVTWGMVRYEADDALAAAVSRYRGSFSRTVILSPDKDLAQLVDGDIVVAYDRMRRRWFDEAAVVDKFGVHPPSIPDYLALVGDSADGFPGIAGWGAKSTAAVLQRYRCIDRVPLDAGLWTVAVRGAQRLASNLAAGLGDALLFRYLATLRAEVPLAEDAADLRWQGAHAGPFEELCIELGFPELTDRVTRWAAL